MSRGQGNVYRPTVLRHAKDCAVRKPERCECPRIESHVWWLDYSIGGERHSESSGSTSKKEALDLLHQRIGDRRAGKLVGAPDRVRVAEYDEAKKLTGGLRAIAERQYTIDGRRSLARLKDAWANLEKFFHAETPALAITADRVDAYAVQRFAEGASPATVNYEKAALRRAYRLAIEKRLLATMPVIKTPKVRNAREGFFTEGGFAALLLELRDPLLVRYLSLKKLTGWRDNELKPLLWAYVDREMKELRVPAAADKGDKALRFPYGIVPDAEAIVDALWETRNGPYVFQRNGKPLKDYRGAWKLACRRAGLARTVRDAVTGELREELPRPHDCRRTAARDYRRFMSEAEIMDLCGWKTRSTFERYNIVRPEDVDAGLVRRFNAKQALNIPASAERASS